MRRWNGWGAAETHYPLPASAAHYLTGLVGPGCPTPDASLESVLARVPPSELPPHPLVTTDPQERLLHAVGQSLPDWAAMRSGEIPAFPGGVAYPEDDQQVRQLFEYAAQHQVRLIPYGGGTSVTGHINPLKDGPCLTVDMRRQNQLLDLDQTNHIATFGAGVCGPDLEKAINTLGYTLGHFPQSFELSTLGGWIATRSSGQQSYHYGRIEALFAGGHMETPHGPWDLPNHPASAAGPDLRQVALGSEGRLGFITRAAVRVRRLPEQDAFYGVFFHTWEDGAQAVRAIAQAGVPLSMLRLSDAQETETTLKLSGKDSLVAFAERGLGAIGYTAGRSLLVFGVTGQRAPARQALAHATAICRRHGGLFTGQTIGKIWRKSRFYTPYLRNTLWEHGYALDTLETALPWTQVISTALEVKAAIRDGLQAWDEKVLVFAHLSHVYADGASLYVTYLFRQAPSAAETIQRWRNLKSAGSQVLVRHGGTISHQHGVGVDHAPYLAAEKGAVGMQILHELLQTVDPQGILNPGKLIT